MNYQIKEVKSEEIAIVHEIIKKCGERLKFEFGLSHWDPPYPIQLLRKDAKEKNVYAVTMGEQTLATFTVSTRPLPYYFPELWLHPNQKAVYVSHLAVLPERQGKGIGSWCMREIEQIAISWDCQAVRLDAYERYNKLLEFYDKLGYERRDIV